MRHLERKLSPLRATLDADASGIKGWLRVAIWGCRLNVPIPYQFEAGHRYGFYCTWDYAVFHWGRHIRYTWMFPWQEWEFVRHTLIGDTGERIANLKGANWQDFWDLTEGAKNIYFCVRERSGEVHRGNACVEEREYRRGNGRWRWLRHFNSPRIERVLSVTYDPGFDLRHWQPNVWWAIDIPCDPQETIPHAIWRFCIEHDLEFLPETYCID